MHLWNLTPFLLLSCPPLWPCALIRLCLWNLAYIWHKTLVCDLCLKQGPTRIYNINSPQLSVRAALFQTQTLALMPHQTTNVVRYTSAFALENYLFLFRVYGCSACTHVCILQACLLSEEARRGCHIPCNWSCRWLWAFMWMLRTKSHSSGRKSEFLHNPVPSSSSPFIKKALALPNQVVNPKNIYIQAILMSSTCCNYILFILYVYDNNFLFILLTKDVQTK